MKFLLALTLCTTAAALAQELPAKSAAPVAIEHAPGLLAQRPHATLRVTFARPMIAASAIGRPGVVCPIVFEPVLDPQFEWLSPSVGLITLGTGTRMVPYRAKLRPGLTDGDGVPMQADDWGVEFTSDEFQVTHWELQDVVASDLEPSLLTPVSNRPRMRLEFSRDVKPDGLANRVYFQDFDSRQIHPAELGFDASGPTDGRRSACVAEPREPLPQQRRWLLVIAREAHDAAGRTLPHLLVVPVGRTEPFSVSACEAFSQPQKGNFVRVQFTSEPREEDAASHFRCEPAVDGVRVSREGRMLEFVGAFEPGREYTVTLTQPLANRRGVALPKEYRRKLTFPRQRPAVVMPFSRITQRASNGLKVPLVLANTGQLTWQIAELPPEQFLAVQNRVREFGEFQRDSNSNVIADPRTGEYLYERTELLIPAFRLPVAASGRFAPTTWGREEKHEIAWELPAGRTAGTFLVEVTGRSLDGRQVGNRSIVSLFDWLLTVKSPSAVGAPDTLQVTHMADNKPVAGLAVRRIRAKPGNVSRTDARGKTPLGSESGGLVLGEGANQVVAGLADENFSTPFPRNFNQREKETLGVIVPDRTLYRPGDLVKAKVFLRDSTAAGVKLPEPENVKPFVETISGTLGGRLNIPASRPGPAGDFEVSIALPKELVGEFAIRVGGISSPKITVADFHTPAFSVETTPLPPAARAARLRVQSALFHGGANAGATIRWRAEWRIAREPHATDDDGALKFSGTLRDEFPNAPAGGPLEAAPGRADPAAVVLGKEAVLDGSGAVELSCAPPFPAEFAFGRARVLWMVDVIGRDGQSQAAATSVLFQDSPQVLGARMHAHEGSNVRLGLTVDSLDAQDNAGAGVAVKAEVYKYSVKVAKEQIGDGLVKFRNVAAFERVWSAEGVTPVKFDVPAEPGHDYVARVTAPKDPHTPPVSLREKVREARAAEIEQWDDTSLEVLSARPRWLVGETAEITVRAPFAGLARVSVETDRVISQGEFEFAGNVNTIKIPVKPSYAPNAFLCVHLIKPGGRTGMPAERFGVCELAVEDPAWRLEVRASTESARYEPGAQVRGKVTVLAGGQPLADADVLLWAVDDALLYAGGWEMPDFVRTIQQRRPLTTATSRSLDNSWFTPWPTALSHFQKGYIQGDGMLVGFAGSIRRSFNPRPLWLPNARTDAAGEVAFNFPAPENLTAYRITAIAQKGAVQFGSGATLVQVSRPITVREALPLALREGDEVALRAVVRQAAAPSAELELSCATSASLELLDPAVRPIPLDRGVDTPASFRARVRPGTSEVALRFTVKAGGRVADAVERRIPVLPATLVRRVTAAGSLPAATPISIPALVPKSWTEGKCDVLLSSGPLLPKLAGLPPLLEGGPSLRDAALQILALAHAERLQRSVPSLAGTRQARAARMRELIVLLWQNRIEGGPLIAMPLWPDSRTIDPWTTALAAWAVNDAAPFFGEDEAPAPPMLVEWLRAAIDGSNGVEAPPLTRAVALLALVRGRENIFHEGTLIASQRAIEEHALNLFTERARLDYDALAVLVMAFARLNSPPAEPRRSPPAPRRMLTIPLARLVAELDSAPVPDRFRARALGLLARAMALGPTAPQGRRRDLETDVAKLAESSAMLRGEDSLWLLLALSAVQHTDPAGDLRRLSLVPAPVFSADGATAAWQSQPLRTLGQVFAQPFQIGYGATFLIQANLPAATPPPPQGLLLERTVRNLTDPLRTGDKLHPVKLGDRLLLDYTVRTEQEQGFLRLRDDLPVGLSALDPRLRQAAGASAPPADVRQTVRVPNHATHRAGEVALYYERFPAGTAHAAFVAHAGAAGVFQWPGARVEALYDTRFFADVPPSTLHVSE